MKKLIVGAVIILVWQGLAMVLQRMVFKSPLDIVIAFTQCGSELILHSLYSLFRLFVGASISLVIGIPVGLLLGYSKKADGLVSPILYVINPIPKIALLPLVMLMFGIGDNSKIFLIVLVMVFQIIISVRDGVKNIPHEYFIPFNAVKAEPKWIIKEILIPASVPNILSSLRIGFATGVSVLFFTETYGTKFGMGYFIMDMWVCLDYAKMYLGMLWLGLIGFMLVFSVDMLEKRLCRWRISAVAER